MVFYSQCKILSIIKFGQDLVFIHIVILIVFKLNIYEQWSFDF